MTPSEHETLDALSRQLLALHKCLLDYQKHIYESTHGTVPSLGAYFALVTEGVEFAWLKTVSEMIVSIDTLLADKSGEPQDIPALLAYAKTLFTSQPPLNDFAKKYLQALTADPAVALAHAKVIALLKQ